MAEILKVLAQVVPVSGTLTTAYTVPGATSTVLNTIQICNQASGQTTIRVSVAVSGGADSTKQYVYYDLPVLGNDTFTLTAGLTLATTDVIRVYSANGQVSFNLFGLEVT